MAFSDWQAFIHMGGYGLYVWLAFALSFLILALLTCYTLWTQRRLKRLATQLQQRQQRLAKRRQQEVNTP